jgi:hypothetical protein
MLIKYYEKQFSTSQEHNDVAQLHRTDTWKKRTLGGNTQ